MTTLTGASTRTITGYLVTLLEFPRWRIDRDVDFTNCHLHGAFSREDEACASCDFGTACRWLNRNRAKPSLETPLADLLQALQTAVSYLRRGHVETAGHGADCDCDTCAWLREASQFLRTHRHKT